MYCYMSIVNISICNQLLNGISYWGFECVARWECSDCELILVCFCRVWYVCVGAVECAHTHITRSDYLEELGSGWGFDLYMLFCRD